MESSAFWDITPCSLLKVNGRSEERDASVSGSNKKPSETGSCYQLFDHEYGGDIFSETSVEFQRNTRRYTLEDRTLREFLFENYYDEPYFISQLL
jgi:hypothetical protein